MFSRRRYFFSTASGLIGRRNPNLHKSISTQPVRTTWYGWMHIDRSSATTTVIVSTLLKPSMDRDQCSFRKRGRPNIVRNVLRFHKIREQLDHPPVQIFAITVSL